MNRLFDWPSVMALGMHQLGLAPEVLWGLTPVELTIMAGGMAGAVPVVTRERLDELCIAFPDEKME
ncbi:MAG: phage tail assembly chaperone [Rhodobacteraceae bacterium]|nr:phage tail assembly chaperone [Paracoccaceae bacterium]